MSEFVLNDREHAVHQVDAFTLGYIEAMFFTESSPAFQSHEWFDAECREALEEGSAGGNIPGDAGFADIHPDSLAAIVADCARFQSENATLLESVYRGRSGQGMSMRREYDESHAGHDFWLTRNGHGVGFWDRGLGDAGEALSNAARAFGESDVFFGDHVDHGNLHWVHVNGARGDSSPSIMPARQAWGYAATWGSMITAGDPGACMYGFDESCRPQSEKHRRDVLAWIADCRLQVIAKPDDYDADELAKLDAFVRHIEAAPVKELAT